MAKYILGIDLGTTSVKVCVLNLETKETEVQYSQDTNSDVPLDNIPEGHEQNVSRIIATLNASLSQLPNNLLKQVVKIGICCQMHGVMLWKNDVQGFAWMTVTNEFGVEYGVDEERVSTLYTWQDGRCDQEFLRNLPTPKSHLGVSTGFGIPTLLWLADFQLTFLKKFNCSGTIGSFVIAMICNLEEPCISYQNAASWGYFSCLEKQWNIDVLKKAKFPIYLLPHVKPSEDIAGRLSGNWHGIPSGTPVGVDLGDLQCSVLSTLETQQDAVINISTSAQVTFIIDNYVPPEGPPTFNPPSNWPYFQNQYVSVAASLNGGNILAGFVNMVQKWIQDLGLNIEQSKIWDTLLAIGIKDDDAASDLNITPTCLGERFDPDLKASITNINLGNTELSKVFRALCRGLIENLHNMFPSETLHRAQITRLVGKGSALVKNEILQKEIQRIYKLPLVFSKDGNAARGAALAALFTPSGVCACKRKIM